jgi:8-oxo-dGTP diphosphatase
MTKLKERYKFYSAVFVILINKNKVLLMRRYKTSFEDGRYSLPSGFIDGNETVRLAAVRECFEETGVKIKLNNIKFVHNLFIKGRGGVWVDYFFECKKFKGIPKISEPNKCDHMYWCDLKKLPKNLIPFVKKVLENYKKQVKYSEYGW